jgi:hypothetical protein
MERTRAFRTALKQLDGSFVRTTRTGSDTAVEFHNPSIKDYVRKRIASDASVRRELLANALFFEQVSCVIRLSNAGKLTYGPMLLTSNDSAVHEAIARTISAKSPSYHFLGTYSSGARIITRITTDIGARLSEVANWAQACSSRGLLSCACRVAADMVTSGDAEDAATVKSLGFIDALVDAVPATEVAESVVVAFMSRIKKHMAQEPTADDWIAWSHFLDGNDSLFDEQDKKVWANEAESFCRSEIQVAVQSSRSSYAAEDLYDNLSAVNEQLSLGLQDEMETLLNWVDEMKRRDEDEPPDPEDRQELLSSDMAGDNAAIDQLFDSLSRRARELE